MKTDIPLFSELYNCYYQVVNQILEEAARHPLSRRDMEEIVRKYGYQESSLSIIPNLTQGIWPFLTQESSSGREKLYRSKLRRCHGSSPMPLTALQKSWLKSLLLDARIRLFLTREQVSCLQKLLADVPPLFRPEDFYYFDTYKDGDDFSSIQYQTHFQTILAAIRQNHGVSISYFSVKGRTTTHTWLPCRLEYGQKEGKFRLYCLSRRKNGKPRMDVLNMGRILTVNDAGNYDFSDLSPSSIDDFLDQALCSKPLVLEITDERNALERVLLHFSCYQKKVERLDSGTYRCSIYYDKRWETELLIQVLSFGPVIKVLGPEDFLRQMKIRVKKQMELTV